MPFILKRIMPITRLPKPENDSNSMASNMESGSSSSGDLVTYTRLTTSKNRLRARAAFRKVDRAFCINIEAKAGAKVGHKS